MEAMSAHRKPKKVERQSEQLEKVLGLLRTGVNDSTADSGRRYEAVMRHRSEGLLDKGFFDDPDMAKRWLFRRWAGLCIPLSAVDSHCAGAIYDQRDSRKCIFTMGASQLLDG